MNGRLAGAHEGGATPFSCDVTNLLNPEGDDWLVVRAEDDPADLHQPRGKQYWERDPAYIWYHRTSGIWQPVWLEELPPVAIDAVRWVPDLARFGVDLTVRFDGTPPPGSRLRVRLTGGRKHALLTEDVVLLSGDEVRRTILLDVDAAYRRRRELTWTPDYPRLIDADIALIDVDGEVIDRVESYFGLRSVAVRDGRFHLNDEPVFLRLVLAQNYWPESHLAAPSSDALRDEVALAKSLGFNGLRIHQKIEDPRFLYWCDRLGMMVWAEAANGYVFDDRAVEMLTRDWLEAVKRDVNHPSIVAWVPLNESWGVPQVDHAPAQQAFVRALYHLTKAIDPSRPAIGNDGWSHVVGDIFGIHDYASDGVTLTERYGSRAALLRTFGEVRPHHFPLLSGAHSFADEAVVLSEFGGLSFAPTQGDKWFGYGKFADEETLLGKYAELVNALLGSSVLAGFCYTQLTDTEQETNGLLTVDRKSKLDVNSVRAINMRPSKAVPSEVMIAVLRDDAERRRRETGGTNSAA